MADRPSTKPACRVEDATDIVRRLQAAGHIAYFAGGCVRDLLLGVEPTDFDIATDALPERVCQLFPRTQKVGAAFGVILVRHNRSVVEVATFRSDGGYEDGRRPVSVHFADAQADARRRDFTINGLFHDPTANQTRDFVGGQVDLRAKTLRAIGSPAERFAEDHLRMLRAVRFASRLGFELDPATAEAIRTHAPMLARISPERIGDELRRMLPPSTRSAAWSLLWDLHLMPVLFRHLPEKPAGPASDDADNHPLFLCLDPGNPVSFPLALAAMAACYRGRNDPDAFWNNEEVQRTVRACRTSLRISNDESDHMAEVLGVGYLLHATPPTVATMKRFLAKPHSLDARRFLSALYRAEPGLTRIPLLLEQFAALEHTPVAPPPLITGDDLAAAGLRPGPAFGKLLDAVYDAQLEGRITTRQQAMEMATKPPM